MEQKVDVRETRKETEQIDDDGWLSPTAFMTGGADEPMEDENPTNVVITGTAMLTDNSSSKKRSSGGDKVVLDDAETESVNTAIDDAINEAMALEDDMCCSLVGDDILIPDVEDDADVNCQVKVEAPARINGLKNPRGKNLALMPVPDGLTSSAAFVEISDDIMKMPIAPVGPCDMPEVERAVKKNVQRP